MARHARSTAAPSRRSPLQRAATPGQEVFRDADAPLRTHGGIAVLRGNLAEQGCVVKLAGNDRVSHRGPARVFDSEEAAFAAVRDGAIHAGDVVVIRYEGPVGGPWDAGDAGCDGRDRGRRVE